MLEPTTLQEFIERQCILFREMRFEALAMDFTDPLIVYLDGSFRVRLAGHVTVDMFKKLHSEAQGIGASNIFAAASNTVGRQGGRFRTDVTLSYVTTGGKILARSRIRYYCLGWDAGEVSVEMIEYHEPGLPGMIAWFRNSPGHSKPGSLSGRA